MNLRPTRSPLSVTLASLACAIAAAIAAPPALAAPHAGSLDPSFSHDGRKITDLFGKRDRAHAVAMQGRRIVVAGETIDPPLNINAHAALVRFTPDGHLDPSFGHNGVAVPRGRFVEADALAIDPDRKIIVAGNDGCELVVARFKPNGRLQRSFGRKGVVRTEINPGCTTPEDLAILRDGRILVAGHNDGASGGNWLIMARYMPGGRLDRDFADHGTLISDLGTGADVLAYGLARQRDGKIVVSGEVEGNPYLARFHKNGSLDASFSADGVAYLAPKLVGDANDVAVLRSGKLLVAGGDVQGPGTRFYVARLRPSGRFDRSFGTEGAAFARFRHLGRLSPQDAKAVGLEPNRRIVACGTVFHAHEGSKSDPRFACARFGRQGALDQSFGRHGRRVINVRPNTHRRFHDDHGEALAIQRNGRIVMAGYSGGFRLDDDFAVARLLGR